MKNFKAGKYINQGYYKSFQPEQINRQWLLEDMELLELLSKADRQLGRLDMYSEHIPDIDLFISMHVLKEATQSSKIEGTQTNMEEALLDKEDISQEKRDDWEEVQNYITAMQQAISMLETIPFSSRLIKETHKILLQGVRGEHKLPGVFRTSQNWIGGASLADAIFIPPVHTSIGDLMSDLEKFTHNEELYFPDLLKIGIIHYQFETIHPFLDGNGRVGRLLITLYLVNKEILKKPILYLSDFFERNKTLYYDNLMRVRTHDDIKQWLKFFLVGIIETAKNGVQTFDEILKLKQRTELKIQTLGSRASNAQKILHYLLKRPIIDVNKIIEITEVSPKTAYNLITDMEALEILQEVTGGKRSRVYVFKQYLNLFN
ncbi:MAG: Fic family protein [Winogradskyella sp.]|uniref:Fic family protein n=1 Tax=Winogradskyella sp. TaxID=1883156 RepID=UPI0018349619|nr:Fic family protein [Winogradskyella sp.]MBT8245900.1 Fic family protein [Winogradskyella sp.]NNK23400.1 Fic family protein [Winogradskyella sp.]